MNKDIKILDKTLSERKPAFIIAEMSGNHNMDINRAFAIIKAAKEAGADAIKLQTYTPDTITFKSDNKCFMAQEGSPWEGMNLYELYKKAYTPWEWHEKLFDMAREEGIICFSTPFDLTAVEFLEKYDVPAYKIASYEINDIPLIKAVAKTGKPIIVSTGIAELSDIELVIKTCKSVGNENIVLLKCTSAYPAPYSDMNINVISNLSQTFECIAGLSDHTLGTEVAIAAIAKGAKVIEKHLTLRRSDGGVDSAFSMEPIEFKNMVKQIRNVEQAIGTITYELTSSQKAGRRFAKSLFVVQDIKRGEMFTKKNIRSIRPGAGIEPVYFEQILGKCSEMDIKAGTPLAWRMIRK